MSSKGPTLAEVAAASDRLAEVPDERIPALVLELAALQTRLAARLAIAVLHPAPPPEKDRLLTVIEAAEILGVSKEWLYRRAGRLPFTRRVGESLVRFSEIGLRRWAATRPKF